MAHRKARIRKRGRVMIVASVDPLRIVPADERRKERLAAKERRKRLIGLSPDERIEALAQAQKTTGRVDIGNWRFEYDGHRRHGLPIPEALTAIADRKMAREQQRPRQATFLR
jgi:hypothetical protein